MRTGFSLFFILYLASFPIQYARADGAVEYISDPVLLFGHPISKILDSDYRQYLQEKKLIVVDTTSLELGLKSGRDVTGRDDYIRHGSARTTQSGRRLEEVIDDVLRADGIIPWQEGRQCVTPGPPSHYGVMLVTARMVLSGFWYQFSKEERSKVLEPGDVLIIFRNRI